VCVVWLGGFGDQASYRVWENRIGEINGRADISAWRTLLEAPVDLLHILTWPAPAKILVDPTSFGEELRARTAQRVSTPPTAAPTQSAFVC